MDWSIRWDRVKAVTYDQHWQNHTQIVQLEPDVRSWLCITSDVLAWRVSEVRSATQRSFETRFRVTEAAACSFVHSSS